MRPIWSGNTPPIRLLVHPLAQTPASAVWQLGRRDLLRIADWDPRMLYSMAG